MSSVVPSYSYSLTTPQYKVHPISSAPNLASQPSNSGPPHSYSISSQNSDVPRRPGPHNEGYDDANHDFIIVPGEYWDHRYYVIRKLGRGSFGQVVEATDTFTNEKVAIKIIKNKSAFTRQAFVEERVVQFLGQHCSHMEPQSDAIGMSFYGDLTLILTLTRCL